MIACHDLLRQGSTDNLSIVFSNLDLSLAVSIHSALGIRILNSVAALAFSFLGMASPRLAVAY